MAELNKKLHLLKPDSTQEAIKLYSTLAEVGDNYSNVKVPAYTGYYKWTSWTQPVLSNNGALGGTDFAVWGTVGSISGKEPYYMFDNNSATYYRGTSTASIIIYNPIALKITNILWETFYSYPRAGNVQGSNDGTTYTTIANFTNAINGNFNIVLSGNTTAYNYYKINITSVNDDVVHCSGLTITATYAAIATVSDYDYAVEIPTTTAYAKLAEPIYYKWVNWTQPVLTSATSFGVVTTVSNDGSQVEWKALDGIASGSVSDAHFWSSTSATSGWWKWVLPFKIKISQIKFYNATSTNNNYTKNAQFFADDAKKIPLGDAFVGINSPWAYNTILVNNVITDTIYFYALSSYNHYITIGELEITAKKAVISTVNDYDYLVNPVNPSSLSMVVSGVKYKVLTS